MSILVQSASMQQLKHEFESFLKRFYRKLLVLQPQIYKTSNIIHYPYPLYGYML